MSYARVVATASAKAYIEQSEAQDRAAECARHTNFRMTKSRAWLDDYYAGRATNDEGLSVRPFTKFNWAPRWSFKRTPPKDLDHNGKEIIEAEFTELADTDAASGNGEAKAGGVIEEAGGFDTPF